MQNAIAGAAPLTDQLPASLAAATQLPGDEPLTMIMTRRSTFDWSLVHTAVQQRRLRLRGGVRGIGLLAEPGMPPRVSGAGHDGRQSPGETWSSTRPAAARRSIAGWRTPASGPSV
jgi:hypothetical protein